MDIDNTKSKPFLIKGFPEGIGEYIEFPNIGELLLMPMHGLVDANFLYAHGPSFYRTLLDKCPLTNRYKHVAVTCYIQLLYPESYSVSNKINTVYQHEWHTDAVEQIFDEPSTIHIIMSDCTATTSFNENPTTVLLREDMDNREFIHLVNKEWKNWGLKDKKIEPQKYATFTNHVHRSTPSEHKEFRFFFRVMESDYIPPREEDKYPCNASHIGKILSDGSIEKIPNIVQYDDRIVINYK